MRTFWLCLYKNVFSLLDLDPTVSFPTRLSSVFSQASYRERSDETLNLLNATALLCFRNQNISAPWTCFKNQENLIRKKLILELFFIFLYYCIVKDEATLRNARSGERRYSSNSFDQLFFSTRLPFSPISFLSLSSISSSFCLSLSLSLSLTVDYFWFAWLISAGSQARCQRKWSA